MGFGELNVSDLANKAAQFGKSFLLATEGVVCCFALLRKLLNANLLDEAFQLMDMLTNGSRYTWQQLSDHITDSCWKIGAARPLTESLAISEDDKPEIRAIAQPKPSTYLAVINHLEGRGVNTDKLPAPMLYIVSKMCCLYGNPLMEQVIERLAVKQSAVEHISFMDLCFA